MVVWLARFLCLMIVPKGGTRRVVRPSPYIATMRMSGVFAIIGRKAMRRQMFVPGALVASAAFAGPMQPDGKGVR